MGDGSKRETPGCYPLWSRQSAHTWVGGGGGPAGKDEREGAASRVPRLARLLLALLHQAPPNRLSGCWLTPLALLPGSSGPLINRQKLRAVPQPTLVQYHPLVQGSTRTCTARHPKRTSQVGGTPACRSISRMLVPPSSYDRLNPNTSNSSSGRRLSTPNSRRPCLASSSCGGRAGAGLGV